MIPTRFHPKKPGDGPVEVDPDVLAWTGRYIQVLVNRRVPLPDGGVWFR